MPVFPAEELARAFTAQPYFRNLDPAALSAVIASSMERSYEPDQIVLLEGEPDGGFLIVLDGWLKVSKISIDGREQILHFLGGGEAFNAVSVFTDTPNPATVTALEPSVVSTIPRARMMHLLDTQPALARVIIRDLAGRVLHLIGLVEDLSLRRVESRFARLLLAEAQDNVIRRKRWATQNEMAARLGTVPDVVSRTVRRLVEQGVLQVTRSEITILDRARLELLANAPDRPEE